jgi:hypothetical protein
MDGGFCGNPIQSTDLVDVDWIVVGLDAVLMDVNMNVDVDVDVDK